MFIFLIYESYKMVYLFLVILYSLFIWWYLNIGEKLFVLKFGNLFVNSKERVLDFG